MDGVAVPEPLVIERRCAARSHPESDVCSWTYGDTLWLLSDSGWSALGVRRICRPNKIEAEDRASELLVSERLWAHGRESAPRQSGRERLCDSTRRHSDEKPLRRYMITP